MPRQSNKTLPTRAIFRSRSTSSLNSSFRSLIDSHTSTLRPNCTSSISYDFRTSGGKGWTRSNDNELLLFSNQIPPTKQHIEKLTELRLKIKDQPVLEARKYLNSLIESGMKNYVSSPRGWVAPCHKGCNLADTRPIFKWNNGNTEHSTHGIGFYIQMCFSIHTGEAKHPVNVTDPIPFDVLFADADLFAALAMREERRPRKRAAKKPTSAHETPRRLRRITSQSSGETPASVSSSSSFRSEGSSSPTKSDRSESSLGDDHRHFLNPHQGASPVRPISPIQIEELSSDDDFNEKYCLDFSKIRQNRESRRKRKLDSDTSEVFSDDIDTKRSTKRRVCIKDSSTESSPLDVTQTHTDKPGAELDFSDMELEYPESLLDQKTYTIIIEFYVAVGQLEPITLNFPILSGSLFFDIGEHINEFNHAGINLLDGEQFWYHEDIGLWRSMTILDKIRIRDENNIMLTKLVFAQDYTEVPAHLDDVPSE